MYVKRWEEMGRGRKADAQFDWQPTHQQRKSRALLGAHSILYYAIRVEQMLAQFDRYQSQSVEPTNLGWLQFQKYCQDSETRARGP